MLFDQPAAKLFRVAHVAMGASCLPILGIHQRLNERKLTRRGFRLCFRHRGHGDPLSFCMSFCETLNLSIGEKTSPLFFPSSLQQVLASSPPPWWQIGRASCRERVLILVVAVSV